MNEPIKITIDPGSGFCFGVERAIHIAEAELDTGSEIYALGEMVHNQVQMNQLTSRGLKVISHGDLPAMAGKTVLIRAHGEPPSAFQLADQIGIKLIDATCPIVTKLQKRISQSSLSQKKSEIQIVIYGKHGHAEVAGLNGNADDKAIVVSSEGDLVKIDFSKPVSLFSQTTMDAELYMAMAETIRTRMLEAGNTDLNINKSACRQVSGRAPALRQFAKAHDVIIFVGGKNSANGAYLFSICKASNENCYYVNQSADIDSDWLKNIKTIGITGATSTPLWQIEEMVEYVKGIRS